MSKTARRKTRKQTPIFKVIWELDLVAARSPRKAAEFALKVIQEPGTECTVFRVIDQDGKSHDVDLSVAESEE